MKKINCIMFIMFMIIFISSFSVKATVNNTTTYQYKDFVYIYRGENIQIIDYYGKNYGKKSKVIVPSEINGRKVVKFGYNFYKDKKYYENNVDSLMLWGFIDDAYVKEIYFPNSIKEIEGMSFVNCKNLKKVVLGNGIKHLDNTTFLNCKNLEQLKLSESLDEFECCIIDDTKVKRISLGKKIKSFIDNGGDECLQSVNVSKKNKYYSSKSGVLYNKKKTKIVYYPRCKKNKTLKLPKTITNIEKYKLSDKVYLKSVFLPKSMKKIGIGAFFNDNKLSKVIFTGKMNIRIENKAFIGCKKLKKITIPKSVKKIGKKAFGYKLNGSKIKGFTIKGYKGTAAEKYAKKNKFKFVELD